ncbi:MAG: GNAT family N-acetyltransferase [Cypionkella sp.]
MIRAEFQTARLWLRPVAAQDEAVVLASLNDLAVSGWLSVVPYPYTTKGFHMFRTEIAKPGQTFAVGDAQGIAGILGLEKGKLGYWFAPRSQGQGYATEAARAVLGWRFAESGGPVASGHFEGNAASANVLRKLGFVETGRGPLMCKALDRVRPHIDLTLTPEAFAAATAQA